MNPPFDSLVTRFRSGAWSERHNVLAGRVEPPAPGDIARLPASDSAEYARLEARGKAALSANQVGAIILAGGMATRFQYDEPKGLFPILDGMSFLEVKIRWLREVAPDMPIFVMTSFHTHAAISAHLVAHGYFGADPARLVLFQQGQFRRLGLDGTFFTSPDGTEDYAAPGHGDFAWALREAGLLDRFILEGGKALFFSNVDNLGATVDPAIIGWHLEHGRAMTVEVAAKAPGDKGGAPARVEGRLQLVEGFAFPPTFDQDQIRVFNTATYLFSAESLRMELELPWYIVHKSVDGQPCLQFEHLAGDLSMVLEAAYLEIERDERFIPVKSPSDVETAQALLRRKRLVRR